MFQWIEGMSVILDDNTQFRCAELNVDSDIMLQLVVVTVGENVGQMFFECKLHIMKRPRCQAVLPGKQLQLILQPGNL